MSTVTQIRRDSWGAIVPSSVIETYREVEKLVNEVAMADHVDEHGSWEFGAEFDKKGRGHALNWDLYGFGIDPHDGGFLAVIQVRQYAKVSRKYPGSVRKSYFLIGRNEDGRPFAHCVSAHMVHAAIRAEKDVVCAAQDWIFGGDYARMLRQGDLALVPVARAAGERESRRTALLEESHRLKANAIRRGETALYAKNPHLVHVPGTHPEVQAEGWYRIMVGRRAQHWSFAPPTID